MLSGNPPRTEPAGSPLPVRVHPFIGRDFLRRGQLEKPHTLRSGLINRKKTSRFIRSQIAISVQTMLYNF